MHNSTIKKERVTQYAINISILLTTVLIMFGIAELIMRFQITLPKDTGPLNRTSWNKDYKESALIPNIEAIRENILIKTNSYGLRNKEIPLNKPSNTLRIAFFGDSFTFGSHIELNETLPVQLEGTLNADVHNPREIEILNFGVNGMNTFQEIMYCLNYGLKFKPDIVILVWISNDIDTNDYTLQDLKYFIENRSLSNTEKAASNKQEKASYTGTDGLIMSFWKYYKEVKNRSLLLRYFAPRVKELFEKMGFDLKTSDKIRFSDLNSNGYKLSFASLKYVNDELNKLGIEFHTIIYPNLQRLSDYYYDILIYQNIVTYCKNNKINHLNLFPAFFGKDSSKLHASEIDYHPNIYANETAATAIKEYLIQNSDILGYGIDDTYTASGSQGQ